MIDLATHKVMREARPRRSFKSTGVPALVTRRFSITPVSSGGLRTADITEQPIMRDSDFDSARFDR